LLHRQGWRSNVISRFVILSVSRSRLFEIGDFRGFLATSHILTRRFLRNLAKWLTPTTQWINILEAIRQRSGSGLIQKSGLESRITFSWHFGLDGVCNLLSALVFLACLCRMRCCLLFMSLRDSHSTKHRFGYMCRPWGTRMHNIE